MTNRPFVARIAVRLEPSSPLPMRYDATRHESEVLVEGSWIPTAKAGVGHGTTRRTDVKQESVDED